jgi:hypothetical protein
VEGQEAEAEGAGSGAVGKTEHQGKNHKTKRVQQDWHMTEDNEVEEAARVATEGLLQTPDIVEETHKMACQEVCYFQKNNTPPHKGSQQQDTAWLVAMAGVEDEKQTYLVEAVQPVALLAQGIPQVQTQMVDDCQESQT